MLQKQGVTFRSQGSKAETESGDSIEKFSEGYSDSKLPTGKPFPSFSRHTNEGGRHQITVFRGRKGIGLHTWHELAEGYRIGWVIHNTHTDSSLSRL